MASRNVRSTGCGFVATHKRVPGVALLLALVLQAAAPRYSGQHRECAILPVRLSSETWSIRHLFPGGLTRLG